MHQNQVQICPPFCWTQALMHPVRSAVSSTALSHNWSSYQPIN